MYRCGGGAGRPSWSPLVPFVLGKPPGTSAAGLDGAGEDESRSTSMADMAEKDKRCRSSGDKFNGWVSMSYLDDRFDENVEERRLLLVRSRSLTRECDFLSGEPGGVPCKLGVDDVRWARVGVASVDFFDGDLLKMEGRTMRGNLGNLV